MQFATVADRAWYAYQCLPRDDQGQPPRYRPLERSAKPERLSNGALRKCFMGKGKAPAWETVEKIAQVLRCSPHWLKYNTGTAPVPMHGESIKANKYLAKGRRSGDGREKSREAAGSTY